MKRILLCVLFFLPLLSSAQNLTPTWVNAIGGSAGDEVTQSTVVDALGNVYIAGSFEGTVNFNPGGTTTNLTSLGLSDAFFAKYTSAGVLVWANRLGSTGGDEVYAITVDGSGNVYVAGYYNGTVDFDPSGSVANLTASGSDDIFYGKYSSAGALTWANAHGSTGLDAAIAIKVDASGNVYVSGYFNGTVDFDPTSGFLNKTSVGSDDIFLGKYSSTGLVLWNDTFGSTGSDIGYSVDLDNTYVYVSGYYSGAIDFDASASVSSATNLGGTDGFFAKYTISAGALGWWATTRSTADDEITSLTLSGTDVYLGGVFSNGASFFSNSGNLTKTSNGGKDVFVAKYDGSTSLPTLTWINSIGTTTDERLNLIALDASANVYCTGYFQGTVDFNPDTGTSNLTSAGAKDTFIAAYGTSAGAYLFAKSLGGTVDDEGTTVAVDASNNVYMGGYFQNTASFNFSSSAQNKTSAGGWDSYIAKYAQLAAEPTAQPTSLNVVALNNTDFTYDITAAAGVTGGYVHIYKVGSAPTAVPTDGIEYVGGEVLSDGSIVKYSDNVVAGNFYGSLIPGTSYFIKIFSFNGVGTTTNYLTTNPLSATITTLGGTAPTITSFTPASGPIGTSVTITGANFSTTAANNIVKFNGTLATVIGTPTATSITTTVPTGATTGKITVEVAGQIATSTADFTIPTGWTTRASMITPRWGSGIGNVGDIAYVAGGYIPTTHQTTVEAYTVSTNSWVAKASRPGVQTSPAYGVINNILYTAGGTNSSVEISDLWSYNPVNDVWTSRAVLPAVRQAACGGVINGQFYVVGGRVGGVSQSSMIAYDPTANTWSAKTSMPTARTAAAAGVINGLLYVAGGISAENSTVFSTLEVYDPVANTWATRASMPTARYGAAYEVLNGMLYVIGGNNSTPTVVSTVEAYNPTSNTWSTIPSLTFARAYAAAIVSNGSIFVTGGHSPANTPVSAMEQYGVSTATPTITSFNPTSGLVGSSVVITGTNFSTTAANNTVRFNGMTATVTGTPTATSITATVPVGATTGTLSVTVGGQTGTSSGTFAVTTALTPTVASFLPISGTIGTSVILTGINFSTTAANNIVKFNGTTATITGTPTATSIATTVPTGATTGKITVEVSGQTGTSLTDFTVTAVSLASEPTNQPTGLTFSSVTSSTYAFSFTAAVAGTTAPDGYIGIRRAGAAPTSVPVDGVTYVAEAVFGDGFINFVGTGTSYTQSSALPLTTYHLAIYSYKGSGTSINYKQVSPLTGSVTTLSGTDTTEPYVNNNTTPTSVVKAAPINVTVTLTDVESGIVEATIYYATLEDAKEDYSNFVSGTMIKGTGDNYTFQIPGSFVKEMGVTYYFYLKNGVGLENFSSNYFTAVQLTGGGLTIPFTGFGSDQTNYRIVSIPVQPTTATADAVFGDDLGAYDKKVWRLFRYQGSTTELNGRSPLEVGKGYWLIANKSTAIDTGPGTTSTVAVFDPFKLTFATGWNQIGNPYPYDVKWQAILTWNGSPAGITKLRTYNGNWQDGAELEKFSGGFVFNGGTSSVTLEIPTIKDPSINGRVSSSVLPEVKNPIDQADWSVNLLLEQGSITNTFGGFGMNATATEGYDAYDDFNLPRFTDFVELNHLDKELHLSSYSKDVVPYNENHTWEFSVESNSNDLVTMKWDNSFFGNNSKQLILWDVNLQRGLDMRTENQYLFSKSRSGNLKVFYGDEKYIKEKTTVNQLVFHDVFPNPAKDNVTISFSLPKEDRVTIEVIDLLGKRIATVADGNFKEGYHEVTWNTVDTSGNAITNGIYITQIKGLKSDHQKRLSINK